MSKDFTRTFICQQCHRKSTNWSMHNGLSERSHKKFCDDCLDKRKKLYKQRYIKIQNLKAEFNLEFISGEVEA